MGAALPLAGNSSSAFNPVAAAADPAVVGSFSAPFQPPGPACTTNQDGLKTCKPAAASMVTLADGRVLYWNGLEGTENVAFNAVAEYGSVAVNDGSRVMDLRQGIPGATWIKPAPNDGGAPPTAPDWLIPGVTDIAGDPNTHNNAALFCSDQVQLADGRILDSGGSAYYQEPGIPGTRYGIVELQGLKNTKIFDPATNTWSQTGSMNYGRWYGSLVTLPNGNLFVASGTTKLIKPAMLNNVTDSGRNVQETETYDVATGKWTFNGTQANKSLPLFPRLHLLPDGKVLYDGAGQAFNPEGQGYDEALWNMDSVYDPATKTWTDVGINGLSVSPLNLTMLPGFRGSSFDIQLPLTAPYTSTSFLSAGGVMGVSPGTYFASSESQINSFDTTAGDKVTSLQTGNLTQGRWYSTGVALPDGSVMAFSGANRDEVVGPGLETAITQAERFDPVTKTWTAMATAGRQRTYHNTAQLLPTGQVLVGGHAPIPTGYAFNYDLPGMAPSERDPSFEIYSPPYIFNSGRPVIAKAPSKVGYGGTFEVVLKSAADAQNVAQQGSVRLVRYGAITHLVDGDQRQIVLPVVGVHEATLTIANPPSANVAPEGPYMLFADKGTSGGLIPSEAKTVFVNHSATFDVPDWVSGATAGEPPQPPSPSPQPVPAPIIPALNPPPPPKLF